MEAAVAAKAAAAVAAWMDGPASLAPLPLRRVAAAASRVRPSGNGGEGEEGRGRCRMYRISLPQPHYCSRLMSAAQMDEGRTKERKG